MWDSRRITDAERTLKVRKSLGMLLAQVERLGILGGSRIRLGLRSPKSVPEILPISAKRCERGRSAETIPPLAADSPPFTPQTVRKGLQSTGQLAKTRHRPRSHTNVHAVANSGPYRTRPTKCTVSVIRRGMEANVHLPSGQTSLGFSARLVHIPHLLWNASVRSTATAAGLLVLSPLVAPAHFSTDVIASAQTEAGSWQLTRGGRYLLCRRFLANLNSFPDLGRFPLVIPIRGDLPYFHKPKWTPLDTTQHFDLVKRLTIREIGSRVRDVRYSDPEADHEAWMAEEAKVKREMDAGLLRLEQTRLDFDHDGLRETVYRLARPIGELRELPWSYHVLAPPSDRRPQVRTTGRSGLDVSTHIEANERFDSFFHEGRFYLVGVRGSYVGLVVYEPTTVRGGAAVGFVPVCNFRPQVG